MTREQAEAVVRSLKATQNGQMYVYTITDDGLIVKARPLAGVHFIDGALLSRAAGLVTSYLYSWYVVMDGNNETYLRING